MRKFYPLSSLSPVILEESSGQMPFQATNYYGLWPVLLPSQKIARNKSGTTLSE
jgi:hypothetical protein